MANEIEITKDFPPSRERAVLLELLALSQALNKEGIDAIVCAGWGAIPQGTRPGFQTQPHHEL
jgi:hypothetical protein